MTPDASSGGEPTVLDWLRSVLRGRPIPLPEAAEAAPPALAPQASAAVLPPPRRPEFRWPWAAVRLAALLAGAVIFQGGLERWTDKSATPLPWILLLAGLGGLMVWSFRRGDLRMAAIRPTAEAVFDAPVRSSYLIAAAILALATFFLSSNNTFRTSMLIAWAASVTCILIGFWEGEIFLQTWWRGLRRWVRVPSISIRVDGWTLAAIAALGLAAYFRFYRLDSVPLEMWSDHAEKLLDVMDVLNGSTPIYFLRNTGREPIQFYLSAWIAKQFGTGLTFLTLKLGMAAAGMVALPFLYGVGKRVAGRPAALAALALAGIAFWPNLLSRSALRFALLPAFAAPALFFLIRGLQDQRRNDVLLAGLLAGAGLFGYTPARVVPLLLVLGVLTFAGHRLARGRRLQVLAWLGAAALVALVVFVPLLRTAVDMPEQFLERSLTRMTSAERPLPGTVPGLLAGNIWNALKMFNWDSGRIWVVTLPGRPLLDPVSGGLFLVGVGLMLARYLRSKAWEDLFLLLSIPLLLAPSFLSLAFPEENPAPHRASAALLPVFVAAGLGAATLLGGLRRAWSGRGGVVLASAAGVTLALMAGGANFARMFEDYPPLFRQSSWNTGDAGRVIRGFAESVGNYNTAHVIPYPHWFDTRLVGFRAGRPGVDYALRPDEIEGLIGETRAQLFLVNAADLETMDRLRRTFPSGQIERFVSDLELHDFWIFFVPARETQQ